MRWQDFIDWHGRYGPPGGAAVMLEAIALGFDGAAREIAEGLLPTLRRLGEQLTQMMESFRKAGWIE